MLPEHKNPIFVSKRPKISEKSPILTQKPRFCAQKARKWGSRSQKAHKNADFVLGGARNSTERPGTAGNNHPKRNKTAWDEAQRPEAQRNATSTQRNRNTTATQHNTRNATQRNTRNVTEAQGNVTQRKRHATAQWGTTKKETTFRVVSFKNWRLPTLPHGSAVPSAQVSLTSLFGMGRGGSSPLLPP